MADDAAEILRAAEAENALMSGLMALIRMAAYVRAADQALQEN